MAPWSSRILSPNTPRSDIASPASSQLPSVPPSSTAPGTPRTRAAPPSRLTEADLLEQAYGIPTLPVPPPPTGTAAKLKAGRPPLHGRSMSHPFPSLFSGKKKRGGGAGGGENFGTGIAGFESTKDEDVSPVKNPRGMPPQYGSTTKQGKLSTEKDLMTGRCMTCDSMVRWPRELKVFRCTVCLTINDLKPLQRETRVRDEHGTQGKGRAALFSPTRLNLEVAPLSLEKTRLLVNQCINTYLLSRLQHDDDTDSQLPTSPLARQTKEETAGESSERWQTEKLSSVPSPSKIPAIQVSPTPINRSRQEWNSSSFEFRQSETTPYSTSSPGDLYMGHMDERAWRQNTDQSGTLGRGSPERDLPLNESENRSQRKQATATKNIFRPLEDYLVTMFGAFEPLNSSFLPPSLSSPLINPGYRRPMVRRHSDRNAQTDEGLSEMDAKTLLLGDFAENGFWWTGGSADSRSSDRLRGSHKDGETLRDSPRVVTLKSPQINWADVNEWFHLVVNAGRTWRQRLDDLTVSELYSGRLRSPSAVELDQIEDEFVEAQGHAQRVLLKATESLLKRPGRLLTSPDDIRFLLIVLANPQLYAPSVTAATQERSSSISAFGGRRDAARRDSNDAPQPRVHSPTTTKRPAKGSSGQHSGIIKRILGLLSNLPNECHHHLVSWFARYSEPHFRRTVDLIGSFVTYRLTRQHGKKRDIEQDPTAGLVPRMSGSGRSSSAALHDALGSSTRPPKKSDGKPAAVIYNDDWQIKAAARVMALLFAANNSGIARRSDGRASAMDTGYTSGRERSYHRGQIVATSDFYNTLLDYSDLIADFEAWESRRGKYAFCRYPFFLSIWAKIQIMEHDARRQMEVKAREAFFNSIMTRKSENQYLMLRVRRECLVEDSLKGVSEVVGSGGEEIKKGLRIEFKGEEGIDAGGLRKEWFLLLVRDVFNPEHGMFTYDEDSQFCYFNPNSFETTDQFFLVGVVLGLAIYNSTILDVAFPPFAFRKLLAAGPAVAPGATSHAKPSMTYSLDDLAEYRPSLAAGLRQLLDFDGDVEATYCRDFVADVDRYGQLVQIPLCPDGEKKPVTNANRREFVDLYVRYLLDTAVTRQFEPFKRGFFTVCGGNALSLFRPEEIELLIRGSDEPLDIASLRAVSLCENWGVPNPAETEPVIQWFWQTFFVANPKDQRKLLSFITGSDRIPAMGATSLVIKISCLGDDCNRFPIARTCFNILSFWRYSSKQKLESMLWRAVSESEGFGLK